MKKAFSLIGLVILGGILIQSSISNNLCDDYSYTSNVNVVDNLQSDYGKIKIDNKIYSTIDSSFESLRLMSEQVEVPYLIEIDYDSKIENEVNYEINEKDNYTLIDINGLSNEYIRKLKIYIDDEYYDREFEIYSIDDNEEVKKLHNGVMTKSDEEEDSYIIACNIYKFSGELQIKINNKGDSPLNIKDIKIIPIENYIVFPMDEDKEYVITYSNVSNYSNSNSRISKDFNIPYYEIQGQSEEIKNLDKTTYELGNIEKKELIGSKLDKEVKKAKSNKILLNSVIIAVILTVGTAVFSRVKMSKEN